MELKPARNEKRRIGRIVATALPPPEAEAPAAVVGRSVVVGSVLPILQVTERTLNAEVYGLARGFAIIAAALARSACRTTSLKL